MGSHHDGDETKGLFICSCRGPRGFWKRPYGRPEGPNRYGTLAKLKAMVPNLKVKPPPPQPRNPPTPKARTVGGA